MRRPAKERAAVNEATRTLERAAHRQPPLGAVVSALGAVTATPAKLRIGKDGVTIGSAPGCDLTIAAPTVSRRHVELSLVPEGVLVRDLESRNGVFYAGQRVESMVLGLGGRISIGAVELGIEVDRESLSFVPPLEAREYRGIAGASVAMRSVFGLLQRLEGSLVTVLIDGESGVGKELVATALHAGSSVASGPLVTVNCGAIPRDLVGSELFGHRRGAFTGAIEARRGAFESADGGTLFLDELGELPFEVQPMLLRALETGEVRPVGDDGVRRVRVRVIAATNRDLEAEVREGRFREDLFYRLAVVRIHVPPLRERPEDVDVLARLFALASGIVDLPEEVLDRLRARRFPGNARELRNVLQVYAALGALPEAPRAQDALLDDVLGRTIDVERPYGDQKDEMVDRFTRLYLQALLAHTGGNQTLAAKLAGLDRTYLGRLLGKHGSGKQGI
jgi:transcriptional regulator with GAF, ATPase, and Fis domain